MTKLPDQIQKGKYFTWWQITQRWGICFLPPIQIPHRCGICHRQLWKLPCALFKSLPGSYFL